MATIYAKNKTTGEFEKVGTTGNATDTTLTLQGSPADAKTTGDAIKDIQTQIDNIGNDINLDGYATESYVNTQIAAIPTPDVPTKLSDLTADATHRTVTDTEKSTWNAKANASDIPTNTVLYSEQTLTNAQQEQARTNLGVRTVTVDSSWNASMSADEIVAAKNAGTIVLLNCGVILTEVSTPTANNPEYVDFTTIATAGDKLMKLRIRIIGNKATPEFFNVDGSMLDLSSEDIANVLGFTPADASVVEQLSTNNDAAHADIREQIAQLNNEKAAFNLADAICPPNQLAADGSLFGDYNEETEELYTGEGCNRGSDFNADTILHTDIYSYIDNIKEKYPFYITKEIMGKDASGVIDIPRYTMSMCYYRAYQKENYPKMYAWKNGSTVIYSLSISPRIGDNMYSTAYVGTVKGTVSAVDNVNQTRTVGGVVYTKDATKDVAPTLVYIRPTALSDHSSGADYGIYNTTSSYAIASLSQLKKDIASAASAEGVSYPIKMNEQIQSGMIYDNDGVNYIRYPAGDRFEDMSEPIKIVIGCNEHGTGMDGAEPSICCARLIKDLATGTDNKMLNWLRKNAIVIAVPIINPYAYDKHKTGYVVGSGYYNANNININRNYDTTGWVHDTTEYTAATDDTTGHSPCGAYAGSENETQYIMNTIALGNVAVSYHTVGVDLLCAYQFNGYSTQNPNTSNTPAQITKKMNDIATIMRDLYGWQFVPYGEDFPDEAAKSLSFITQVGCTGGLIEMCIFECGRDGVESKPHTSLVLEGCYTEMLTTLYSFINDYDQSVRI